MTAMATSGTSRHQDNRELVGGPRPLIPIIWLRFIMVASNLAIVPVAFAAGVSSDALDELTWNDASTWTDPSAWSDAPILLLLAMPALSFTALIAWSGVASVNAGRARDVVRHQKKPSAFETLMAWFIPLSVIVLIIVGLSVISQVADDTRESIDSGNGDGEMAVFALGSLLVFAVCLATYRPYAVLRNVSRWVSGDQVRFRNWFLSPFIGAIMGACLVSFHRLAQLSESLTAGEWVLPTLVVAVVSLPWVCWLMTGNRAMADLEASTELAHQKSIDDARVAMKRAGASAE